MEMPNRRSRAKGSPTRLPPNDADVDGASAVRPATTVGRGGRAVRRGQARGPAQGQAVAAGTSSRLSLLMLCGRVSCRVRAAGASLVTYIYCVNQSVVLVLTSEVVRLNAVNPVFVSRKFRSYSVRARSAARARVRRRAISIPFVSGCAPPSTRRAVGSISSSIVAASRRSSSVAAGSAQSDIA